MLIIIVIYVYITYLSEQQVIICPPPRGKGEVLIYLIIQGRKQSGALLSLGLSYS